MTRYRAGEPCRVDRLMFHMGGHCRCGAPVVEPRKPPADTSWLVTQTIGGSEPVVWPWWLALPAARLRRMIQL